MNDKQTNSRVEQQQKKKVQLSSLSYKWRQRCSIDVAQGLKQSTPFVEMNQKPRSCLSPTLKAIDRELLSKAFQLDQRNCFIQLKLHMYENKIYGDKLNIL
ncbi:hypothetical protein CEXT_202051 [Caerostris extrusa]|uniref:Uncharacterized protein n=1 Tax=Caerostris extrusa TaxID=172846 RepID=A0AAV4MFZ1_CAEEX|nr:hypothetical protein CEXT_202051 [Caerostris extrusa]